MGRILIIKDANYEDVSLDSVTIISDTFYISITSEGKVSIANRKAKAIYYTTDGSVPTIESSKYEKSFAVSSGTTINAISVYSNGTLSEVITKKYISYIDLFIGNMLVLPKHGIDSGSGVILYYGGTSGDKRGCLVVPKSIIPSDMQYISLDQTGSGSTPDYDAEKIYDILPIPSNIKSVTLECNSSYYIGVILVTKNTPKVSDSGWKSATSITIDVSAYTETVWLAINAKKIDNSVYSGDETIEDYGLSITYTE